jgi:hypothetical protein
MVVELIILSQELALHYPQVFVKNTPAVAVLKCQYDWNARYKPISNPLSGFTKTKRDPNTVQAWRFKRGDDSLVRTTWQPIASMTAPWLGMDGKPGTLGFCKLRGRAVVRLCAHSGVCVWLSVGSLLALCYCWFSVGSLLVRCALVWACVCVCVCVCVWVCNYQ